MYEESSLQRKYITLACSFAFASRPNGIDFANISCPDFDSAISSIGECVWLGATQFTLIFLLPSSPLGA